MSESIAHRLESALLALFQADATITSIGPDLRHGNDQSKPRSAHAIIVQCVPAENANFAETGGGVWFRSRANITAGGWPQRDESGERVDALYSRVETILFNITRTQLNALLVGDLAGISIDGIVHEAPDEINEQDAIGRNYALTLHGHTT